MCNQVKERIVQLSDRRRGRWILPIVALLTVLSTGAQPASPSRAETAARQIETLDLRGAAVTLRQALTSEPENALLQQMAATLLTITGDAPGAETVWRTVLTTTPNDALAQYGMGIVALLKGDRARARTWFQMRESSADLEAYLLISRYLDNLEAAPNASAAVPLAETPNAAGRGLLGIQAARSGDHRRALVELEAALKTLPGDPYGESRGLLLTFLPESPLRTSFQPLPAGNGLTAVKPRQEKPLTGVVTLEPENVGENAGYVAFRIDDVIAGIINYAPYRFNWNTASTHNGSHRIEIIVYDKQGQEVGRFRRDVVTLNANAPENRTVAGAQEAKQRAVLWRALTPSPSRAALAYTAFTSAQALGESEKTIRFLEWTAAFDPDYRDVRAQFSSRIRAVSSAPVSRASAGHPAVALTFDDGPKPGATETLLEILRQEQAPATFFLIGRHTTAYPELAQKIAAAGMQIENHTYTHPNLTRLDPREMERELLRTVVSIRIAADRRTRFFRPPGDNWSRETARLAAQWGLTPCLWTINGYPYEQGSPETLVRYILERTTPGSIILLHHGRPTTLQALPQIIRGLRQRGLDMVTLDQLLK